MNTLKPLFYCVNISYLVDRCNSPAPSRSRQTLEKNVLSWALAWTGSVVFTRQVSPDTHLPYCAHAHFLFLFGAIVFEIVKVIRETFYYFISDILFGDCLNVDY